METKRILKIISIWGEEIKFYQRQNDLVVLWKYHQADHLRTPIGSYVKRTLTKF